MQVGGIEETILIKNPVLSSGKKAIDTDADEELVTFSQFIEDLVLRSDKGKINNHLRVRVKQNLYLKLPYFFSK